MKSQVDHGVQILPARTGLSFDGDAASKGHDEPGQRPGIGAGWQRFVSEVRGETFLQPGAQRFPMTGKPLLHNVVCIDSWGTVDHKTPWNVCRVGHDISVVTKERSYALASRGVLKRVLVSRFQSGDIAAYHLSEQFLLAFKSEVKAGCSDAQAGREVGE